MKTFAGLQLSKSLKCETTHGKSANNIYHFLQNNLFKLQKLQLSNDLSLLLTKVWNSALTDLTERVTVILFRNLDTCFTLFTYHFMTRLSFISDGLFDVRHLS